VFTTLRGLRGHAMRTGQEDLFARCVSMEPRELYKGLLGTENRKMQCPTYGLEAHATCPGRMTRGPLAICKFCYANTGTHKYPSTKLAHMRRAVAFLKDPRLWVRMISGEVLSQHSDFLRWHDSGDFLSIPYLSAVQEVAKRVPEVKFLAFTRTYRLESFLEVLKKGPKNLIIRPSALLLDQKTFKVPGISASAYTVSGQGNCPAVENHRGCADNGCRLCWLSPKEPVSFRKHN
jgi:hypothetical protein